MIGFLSVLILFINGFLMVSVFWPYLRWQEKLGLGYWLYSFLFTFLFFLINLYFHIPYTLFNGWIIHIVLGGIFFVLFSLNWKKNGFVFEKRRLEWWENIILLIVCSWLFLLIILCFLTPAIGYDGIYLYEFLGEVFAKEGTMISSLKYQNATLYPYHVVLLNTWAFLANLPSHNLTSSFLYISLVLAIWGWSSRQLYGKWFSWVTLLFVSFLSLFDAELLTGYNNINTAGFIFFAFLYFIEALRTSKVSFVFLVSFLVGGHFWCRTNEPWWLLVILGIGYFLFFHYKGTMSKKVLVLLISFVVMFSPKIVWEFSKQNWKHLIEGQRLSSLFQTRERIHIREKIEKENSLKKEKSLSPWQWQTFRVWFPRTLFLMKKVFFQPQERNNYSISYNHLVLLFLWNVVTFFLFKELQRKQWLWGWFFLLIGSLFLLMVGIYLFIPNYPEWETPSSPWRMMVFLEPSIKVWFLSLVGELFQMLPNFLSKIKNLLEGVRLWGK